MNYFLICDISRVNIDHVRYVVTSHFDVCMSTIAIGEHKVSLTGGLGRLIAYSSLNNQVPMDQFELDEVVVSIISAYSSALRSVIPTGHFDDDVVDNFLEGIFPQYTTGTTSSARQELVDSYSTLMNNGSSVWRNSINSITGNSASVVTSDPNNSLYPMICNSLVLWKVCTASEALDFISQLQLSYNGLVKVQSFCMALLNVVLATHVPIDNPQQPLASSSHCGRGVGGGGGGGGVSNSVTTLTLKTWYTVCLNSGYNTMYPLDRLSSLNVSVSDVGSGAKKYVVDNIPQEVIDFLEHTSLGLSVMGHVAAFFVANSASLSPDNTDGDSQAYRSFSRLLNNPGVRLHYRRNKLVVGNPRMLYVSIRPGSAKRHLKCLNQLFPYTSQTDKRHQTMHVSDFIASLIHRSTLSISRDLKTAGLKDEPTSPVKVLKGPDVIRYINRVLSLIPVGTNNPLTCALMINVLGHKAGYVTYRHVLQSSLLHSAPLETMARFKALSALVRRGQCAPNKHDISPMEVTALAYLELAFGRSCNITDWDEERSNRCSGTINIQAPQVLKYSAEQGCVRWENDNVLLDPKQRVNDEKFYDLLRLELLRICRPLVTRRATSEVLDDFMMRRSEWMASGSGGGASLDLASLDADNPKWQQWGRQNRSQIKLSKRGWAESVPISQIRNALYKQKPREEAHASEKFENGKARAIYGVDPIHYCINTYATKGFEERLHLIEGLEKGLSGLKLAQHEHLRANLTTDGKIQCDMIDFADFNRHHTPRAQALLFEVFADLGRSVGASNDWVMANTWIARSKSNMFVRFPHSPQLYKVDQGMFSGTRSTDLINTLLNLAYFNIARKFTQDKLTIAPSQLYHVHQGDDVWLSNYNVVWSRINYYVMHNMGFIFQKNKQMFGPGRGEYLRVLYQNGVALGYSNRSIVNFLLRPLQNDQTSDPVAWANTITEGCATMARRGIMEDMCHVIYDNNINYWCKARAAPKDKAGVRIHSDAIRNALVCGGLGCPRPFEVSLSSKQMALPKLATDDLDMSKFPSIMTNDWIAKVSLDNRGREDHHFKAPALRAACMSASYTNLPWHMKRTKAWFQYKEAWRRWNKDYTTALNRGRSFVQHHTVRTELDCAHALNTTLREGFPPYNNTSVPLKHNILQVTGSPETVNAMGMYNISSVIHKMSASSRFKSVSLTATAYGITVTQALKCILSEAAEDSSASTDARITIQHILASPNSMALELLMSPSSSPLICMAPFIDINMLTHVASQMSMALSQVLARTHQRDMRRTLASIGGPLATASLSILDLHHIATNVLY